MTYTLNFHPINTEKFAFISFLGIYFSKILVLLAPLWKLWGHTPFGHRLSDILKLFHIHNQVEQLFPFQ